MKIKCSLVCRVTENWKGGQQFEIPSYEAHHYKIADFKVEYKLVIHRINSKHEQLEVVREGSWFVKPETNTGTRFLSFADATFAYSEKSDEIYLQRDYATV